MTKLIKNSQKEKSINLNNENLDLPIVRLNIPRLYPRQCLSKEKEIKQWIEELLFDNRIHNFPGYEITVESNTRKIEFLKSLLVEDEN